MEVFDDKNYYYAVDDVQKNVEKIVVLLMVVNFVQC
jgi:hypothetical protein